MFGLCFVCKDCIGVALVLSLLRCSIIMFWVALAVMVARWQRAMATAIAIHKQRGNGSDNPNSRIWCILQLHAFYIFCWIFQHCNYCRFTNPFLFPSHPFVLQSLFILVSIWRATKRWKCVGSLNEISFHSVLPLSRVKFILNLISSISTLVLYKFVKVYI